MLAGGSVGDPPISNLGKARVFFWTGREVRGVTFLVNTIAHSQIIFRSRKILISDVELLDFCRGSSVISIYVSSFSFYLARRVLYNMGY